MPRIIILSLLLVAAILLPSVGEAVHIGQSPDDVRAELGSPNGIRSHANKETWVYSGDITIEFEDSQLVRAKGLLLESTGIRKTVQETTPAPEPVTKGQPVKPATPKAEAGPVESSSADSDSGKPLMQDMADTIDDYEHLEERAMEEFGVGEVPESATFLEEAISIALPVFLTFIFLLIAFKIVGAEAMKIALLLIAVIDLGVVWGVQWFFLDFMEFPMTFYADTAASIIVMLVLITKWTHAKQLPTAIRVVITAKVASMVAFWILALFVLHNL